MDTCRYCGRAITVDPSTDGQLCTLVWSGEAGRRYCEPRRDHTGRDYTPAYTLWRAWYALEDYRPADITSPEYGQWAALCAALFVDARAAESRTVAA